MTSWLRKLTVGFVAIVSLVAVWAALFDGPMIGGRHMVIQIVTSVATGAFIFLSLLGGASVFAAMYLFYRMVDSPRAGLTIFDARSLDIASVFSDRYLSSEGKVARKRLIVVMGWFLGAWVGAALLGVGMYLLHGVKS
jgi:hypothetical protein